MRLCGRGLRASQQLSSDVSSLQSLGAADPNSTTHFSVYLPLTNQAALEQLVNDQTNSSSPSYHKWLTPAEFKARFGPRASDVAKVSARLEAAGFTIDAVHTQSIEVTGPVWAVENLFSTRLNQMRTRHGNIKFSAANHQLSMPAELAAAGSSFPPSSPSSQRMSTLSGWRRAPPPRASSPQPATPRRTSASPPQICSISPTTSTKPTHCRRSKPRLAPSSRRRSRSPASARTSAS